MLIEIAVTQAAAVLNIVVSVLIYIMYIGDMRAILYN